MSTAARSAPARPSSRRAGSPRPRPAARRRPQLVALPEPAPVVAGTGIFAAVVVGLLLSGMVVLLVLNTSLAQGAFELSSLSKAQSDLEDQEQQLLQDVALKESPEALQRRALQLHMVPVASPVFLRLSDGAVLGVPVAAAAPPRPAPKQPAIDAASTSPDPSGATGAAATSSSTTTAAGRPAGIDAAVADPAPAQRTTRTTTRAGGGASSAGHGAARGTTRTSGGTGTSGTGGTTGGGTHR
ncbi:MAG: hypothetical protein GC157_08700 [Frankiales bacterium]|nr:hypothetical protein [Frankiales bacterium]